MILFQSQYEKERLAFGQELRKLRNSRNVTGMQLAKQTGMSQSKLSKLESGILLPSTTDLTRICAALGVSAAKVKRLHDRLGSIRTEYASWRLGHGAGLAERQREVAERERKSEHLRIFQPVVIPGLLQTPPYARCVMELSNVTRQPDIEAGVAERIARQSVLYDTGKNFEFLITESALLSRFCAPEVVTPQLERLWTLSQLPHVSIGLLPNRVLLPWIPQNSFALYDSALAFIETSAGGVTVTHGRDIQMYLRMFEEMRKVAVFSHRAAEFLEHCKLFLTANLEQSTP